MRTLLGTVILAIGLISCSKIKDKAKDTINQSGEAVGETATEFIEGVGTGIEKTLSLTIEVSDTLSKQGLRTGKYYVNSSDKGVEHILNVYVIFDQDLKKTIMVKAFDKDGVEMGRVTSEIQGKKNDAAYIEFKFDPLSNLENKGKITIE